MYEEFFGIEESEQYAFYRVPKLLFTNERYRNLSAESKLLYGLFLDRMGISRKNGWVDCNLRRTAATGAFASGHPAEPNGHLH